MAIPLFQVDAFSEKPFAGNPAAVCLLKAEAAESWMQAVAAEMNLSETAFLWPEANGFRLRWFTPTVEVDLCGHATLASVHVLSETGQLPEEGSVFFQTRSGRLKARREGDQIELDFPARPSKAAVDPGGLCDALGVRTQSIERSAEDYLVELATETELRQLEPDFRKLAQVRARGVIVTSPSSDPAYDFVSRFFAPASGVNEDPVTGSAHCTLGPFWQRKFGKDNFLAFQASKRGGVVRVQVSGDRVLLSGKAVTVFRGEWV